MTWGGLQVKVQSLQANVDGHALITIGMMRRNLCFRKNRQKTFEYKSLINKNVFPGR